MAQLRRGLASIQRGIATIETAAPGPRQQQMLESLKEQYATEQETIRKAEDRCAALVRAEGPPAAPVPPPPPAAAPAPPAAASAPPPAAPAAAAPDPDADAVRALIEDARRADLAGDRAFYERVLTRDFTMGTTTGDWESRESKLAWIGDPRHKVLSETVSGLQVRVHGATAVATYRVEVAGELEGKPVQAKAIVTATFVKEAAGWMLVALHASPMR